MRELSLRPPWYSPASLFILCGIALFIVFAAVANWELLWLAGIATAGWVIGIFGASVDVTKTAVLFRAWPLRQRSALRDQIATMHLISQYVTFEDAHQVLLKIPTFGRTPRQWLLIAEALAVPLYDHRTKMGLGHDARQGRLMQRPGPHAE